MTAIPPCCSMKRTLHMGLLRSLASSADTRLTSARPAARKALLSWVDSNAGCHARQGGVRAGTGAKTGILYAIKGWVCKQRIERSRFAATGGWESWRLRDTPVRPAESGILRKDRTPSAKRHRWEQCLSPLAGRECLPERAPRRARTLARDPVPLTKRNRRSAVSSAATVSYVVGYQADNKAK